MSEVLQGKLHLRIAQASVFIQPLLRLAFACRHFESQCAFGFFFCDVALDRLLQFEAAGLCTIIENNIVCSFVRFGSEIPVSIIFNSYCNDIL